MDGLGVDLDSMRTDYRLVRKWWRESEGWSAADLVEADECVRAAVNGGDAELIGCWAKWLAEKAAVAREAAERCRAAEQRIRTKNKEIEPT